MALTILIPALLLKHHYYGFCFDEDASVKVYSPYSINEFFASVAREDKQGPKFLPFWMMSSKDNASLKSYLHSKHNQKFATMATQSN